MVFSSMVFIFLFLPLLCAAYFLMPGRVWRNVLLCCASLLFYAWGEPRYIVLMLISIAANYCFARVIDRDGVSDSRRIILLVAAVSVNLAILFFFKYAGFFTAVVNSAAGTSFSVISVPLPVGISFYTFQALSYIVDVYRRKTAAQKNFLNLTLYIALFPQLIAGPIVRYTDIEAEINCRKETFGDFIAGLEQFIVGLAAKVVIANNMAVIADRIFADYKNTSTAVLWIAAIAYAFQIFFDFSGYSRMAVGLGRMFGFHFPENFKYPYTACSITDFWRRWHITLSSWFKDYVYIPLGGNRGSKVQLIRNMLITWMLTGFWHGASWNFILWGAYYGVLLIIEKIWLGRILEKLPRFVTIPVTLFFVCIGWVLFRTTAVHDIPVLFVRLFTPSTISTVRYIAEHADIFGRMVFFIPAVLASTSVLKPIYERMHQTTAGYGIELLIIFFLFFISVCLLVASTYNPFIYFRF
jgi:alginate O-acetyltransferase complex protein AlgI